jgi:hypothetical protein
MFIFLKVELIALGGVVFHEYISLTFVQYEKDSPPILVTELEIVIEVRPEHLSKA